MTRLKTLLSAAALSFYTKRSRAAKPKYRLESMRRLADETDAWLFDGSTEIGRSARILSCEMATLSASLNGLRETLNMLSGVTPFPSQALPEKPCSMVMHDADLFDGEPDPVVLTQDTVMDQSEAMLFEIEPSATKTMQHAA